MSDKLEMQSSNIIQENIDYIASRFPNVLKEVKENGKIVKKIDFDILKEELSTVLIDDKQERYQMTWPDKKKSIHLANSRTNATLRPVKEKSVDFDNTQNLYIEGDNLEVLKLLRETYLGKVKMIYIDPPYNTGSDFIYEDDFKRSTEDYLAQSGQYDELGNRLFSNNDSNGRFHTDWLNMIYPRLKIAKDLMTNDGLIFISIDDHELMNLLKICDEIFGNHNCISILKWKKKKQPSFLSIVADIMEYVVVYSKNKSFIKKLSIDSLSDSDKPIINSSNKEVQRHFESGLRVKATDVHLIKKGTYHNKSMDIEYLQDVSVVNGRTINSFDAIARFRNDQQLITKYCIDDLIFITKNLGFRRDLSEEEKGSGKTITDLLLDWGQNQDASNETKRLFNITGSDGIFDNPKPTLLVKNIIKTCCEPGDIILDFFSGSGTTADAVFQYNVENETNLKFILVQLPENLDDNYSKAKSVSSKNIIKNAIKVCDELNYDHFLTNVGEERIRRSAKYIINNTGFTANELDTGFRVLKLDSSNMTDVFYNPNAMSKDLLSSTVDNIKSDRTPLDLLFQVMLELGIELSAKIEEKEILGKQYFIVNENDIVACFDNNINEDLVKELASIKPLYAVFRDSSFSNDSSNINCEQIFKTISPNTNVKVL